MTTIQIRDTETQLRAQIAYILQHQQISCMCREGKFSMSWFGAVVTSEVKRLSMVDGATCCENTPARNLFTQSRNQKERAKIFVNR